MPVPRKKRVYFTLHAPEAGAVYVAGTFNDWDPSARPLKRGKKGVWRTWMNLSPGQYEYRFVVDERWQEDPACGKRIPNDYGGYNSVLEV